MLEAGEATTGALDLFDTEVLAFGRSVRGPGAVVVQDLASASARRCRRARGSRAPRLRDSRRSPCRGARLPPRHVVGEIDVADRLLGEPRTEQLVVGVAEAQAEQEPLVAAFVEPLGPGQEELADPEERIVLATAVAESSRSGPVGARGRRSGWRPARRGTDRPPGSRGRDKGECRPGSSRRDRWRRPGPPAASPGLGARHHRRRSLAAFPSTMSITCGAVEVDHARRVDGRMARRLADR